MPSVFITGASRGIGLEFVRQLSQQDSGPEFVFASCRNPDSAKDLQALAKDCNKIKLVQLDVQKEETYGPAVEKVSSVVGDAGLNVLINNAGIAGRNSYESVSREFLTDVLDINVIGPMRITQAFLPLLKKGAEKSPVKDYSIKRGAVINISSGLGGITESSGGLAGYRESKAALNMFSKSLSIALAKDKILVLSQCPGWVQTDLGGAKAARTTEESVSGMLTIFSQATEKHTGLFIATTVPIQTKTF